MMKVFYKVHKWLALPFGIIISIIAFTGAILVFENDINKIMNHDRYYVKEVKRSTIPLDSLMNSVNHYLAGSAKITGVTIYNDPHQTYQVSLSKPPKSSLFIDQYSGEITGEYSRKGFFLFVFKLHRWLLDTPDKDRIITGRTITGTSTLMFMITLLTGIFIWYPRTKKGLWSSLRILVSGGGKKFLKGLHVAGGMYALVILLCLGLTGLTWSFKWYSNAVNTIFGVEKSGNEVEKRMSIVHESIQIAKADSVNINTYALWQETYDALHDLYPRTHSITINNGAASVTLSETGNGRASDKYLFNSKSGTLTPAKFYSESKTSDKMHGWIYSIHTGSFGGMTTRILWFIAALIGGTLPLTGYYIWIRHLKKRRRRK